MDDSTDSIIGLILGAPAPLALVLRSPPRGMQPERGVARFWGVRLCLFARAHGPTWCFRAAGESAGGRRYERLSANEDVDGSSTVTREYWNPILVTIVMALGHTLCCTVKGNTCTHGCSVMGNCVSAAPALLGNLGSALHQATQN
ncbi:hypothetical protein NDU88_002970 [Pleurodeles waltl]|uniref:Uncharacterized protein n=1 Tax=Pleurodeles waltl TaxID=8319 RepID=A0AAV7L4W6_PLEWA|nr:hypothetical protein NDU88_002970 [Pleurodeles waltl]